MNTESQTDRITQLEASCAAMREALERIEKFEEEWGPHSLTAWNEVVATCKQSLSTTDAGKSLLAEIDRYRALLEKIKRMPEDPDKWVLSHREMSAWIREIANEAREALQPAKEQ